MEVEYKPKMREHRVYVEHVALRKCALTTMFAQALVTVSRSVSAQSQGGPARYCLPTHGLGAQCYVT